jgi:hypothetical protein
MAIRNLSPYKSALVAAAITAVLPIISPAHAAGAHRLDLSTPRIVFAFYGEHVSHITQHEPFTSNPSDYGYNTIDVAITFEEHGGDGPFLTLADGYNLTRNCTVWTRGVPIARDPGMYEFNSLQYHGALGGPRETFSARFGWRWTLN